MIRGRTTTRRATNLHVVHKSDKKIEILHGWVCGGGALICERAESKVEAQIKAK